MYKQEAGVEELQAWFWKQVTPLCGEEELLMVHKAVRKKKVPGRYSLKVTSQKGLLALTNFRLIWLTESDGG